MANTKISALPAPSALVGSEPSPGVQGGADVGIRPSDYAAYMLGAGGLQAAIQPAYISGNYYLPPFVMLASGSTLTANSIHWTPFVLPASMTIKALGVFIATAAAAGNIQLAIYANVNGRPSGNALVSTASILTTSLGSQMSTLGSPTLLPAGVYWFGVNADATAGGVVILSYDTAAFPLMAALIGTPTLANVMSTASTSKLILTAAQTFGTWPSAGGLTFVESPTAGTGVPIMQAN